MWKIFGARAEEAMRAITQEGLTKAQALGQFGCVVGIANCSFEVPRGEIFCVMGLSGSGKSTMVRHINRLIEPTAGRIEVLGRDVLALGEGELRKLRAAQIGMVFQHMALFPHRTVRDNVAFPLQVQGQPIGIGGSLAAPPLPHHRAYGSVHGGSTDLGDRAAFDRSKAEPGEEGVRHRVGERGTVADPPWAMRAAGSTHRQALSDPEAA